MDAIVDNTAPEVGFSRSTAPRGLHLRHIPILWLLLAVFATAVVAEASTRSPISSLEQQIAPWPPRLSSAVYLKRVFVEPFFRWDALFHFLRIVSEGYRSNSAVLAFYPLYPMLARAVYLLGVDPAISLLLVSWLAGVGYLLMFRRLAALDLAPGEAARATTLLLIFPMSLMLFVPYMESLFLLFAAAALYLARKKRWMAAGLAAMLATLTKQPGILLVFPLAYELAADRSPRGTGFWREAWRWSALALAPVAMVLWTAFRSFTWDPNFSVTGTVPEIILRALVSSRAGEMVVSRPFAWPWQIIADAAHTASAVPADRLNALFNLGGYVLIILLFMARWKDLRPSYRVYVLCILIFTLLDYSFDANTQPLSSMFRHAYLAFPVFLGTPRLVRDKLGGWAYTALSLAAFMGLLYTYVMDGWII